MEADVSLSKNDVHQGDCVSLLEQLPAESIDLVFADPPFNIGYQYDVYDDSRKARDYLSWCRSWIDGVHRCLKPNGTFWLAIGDEFAAELKIASQDAGFHSRSWVIWYYTFGVNCARGFSRSHTHLFHFVKDPKDFTFNANNPRVRVKSARELVYADGRANPKGRLPDNTWILRPQDAPESFQSDDDTWYFARVAGTFKEREGFHGCQMPEQLLGRIVRISSNPNDLVLDPFSGSGTTLSVAKKLGRQWMGFELSSDYVTYIRKRMKTTKVGDELDGPADPLKSAPSTAKGKRRKKSAALDHETAQQIVRAFQKTSQGHSADHLLCDPELNKEFIAECKAAGLVGNSVSWNQALLRLRKSKKLPKATEKPIRLSFREMDQYSFASEIAMHLLAIDFGLTLDNILCSHEFAAEFDRIASEFAAGFTSFQYRWAALAFRKRAGLRATRNLASEHYGHWSSDRLPRRKQIDAVSESLAETAGVYCLYSQSDPIYVGEAEDIGKRIERLATSPAWQELEVTDVMALEDETSHRHALQCVLVQRLDPKLNSSLLRHQTKPRKRILVPK